MDKPASKTIININAINQTERLSSISVITM